MAVLYKGSNRQLLIKMMMVQGKKMIVSLSWQGPSITKCTSQVDRWATEAQQDIKEFKVNLVQDRQDLMVGVEK